MNVKMTTPEDLARDNIAERGLEPAATIGNVAAASRQFAEVKGAIQLAREFPRDEVQAFRRMRRACERKAFAEDALFAFPRGDQIVSGASIRLIEELVRCYRNIDYGFRIMEMRDDRSLVEAFCWDVENNIKARREFWVMHVRETKSGNYPLTSPRDIYETVANMAQRRVRSCVEEMLPVDLLEEAKALCQKTMKGSGDIPFEDRVREMVLAFDGIGVSKEMLEQHLGHPLKALVVQQLPKLRQVFNSINDGLASREDFFKVPGLSSDKPQKKPVSNGDKKPEADDKMSTEERAILEQAKKKTEEKRGEKTYTEPGADKALGLKVADPGKIDFDAHGEVGTNRDGMTPEDIAEAERLEREEAEAYEREQDALNGDQDDAAQDTDDDQNDAQGPAEAPENGNGNGSEPLELEPPQAKPRGRKPRAVKK